MFDASIVYYWLQFIHILIFSVFCPTHHMRGCEHYLALLDCLSLKLDMSLSSLALCSYYVMCVETFPIFLHTLSSPSSEWELEGQCGLICNSYCGSKGAEFIHCEGSVSLRRRFTVGEMKPDFSSFLMVEVTGLWLFHWLHWLFGGW